MSEETSFAPPPFKPEEALQSLKRHLRDLRLAERGPAFELKGQSVVELAVSGTTIEARLAKRPQRTPEWTTHVLRDGPGLRRFVDLVKQQLARWSDE
jgi:hypothetical protein